MTSTIATRLDTVRQRIVAAAERCGRDPASIGLVAVSKRKPSSDVQLALAAGAIDFGENYVQELADKASTIGPGPRWHFIGHLQRNKINALLGVEGLALVHGLDSVRLAHALDQRLARPLDVLLHVDVAEQDSKSGVRPTDLAELVAEVRAAEHLRLRGLMTMPPPVDSPEDARPYFRRLRTLALEHGCEQLSMGMTHDFEVAIEEGATWVRVGTAIFGDRA